MKNFQKLLLSLSFILFTSLTLTAQKVYQPEDLTPKLLSEAFDAAFIEVTEIEEDYIKVQSDYKYYLDIDSDKRYIVYTSSFTLNEKASKENILDFINLINKDVALIKAYTNSDHTAITYSYYFWTDGGFTPKSMIGALKLMDAALDLSLSKDEKGVL